MSRKYLLIKDKKKRKVFFKFEVERYFISQFILIKI
jgi:hypothetical protein